MSSSEMNLLDPLDSLSDFLLNLIDWLLLDL